MKLVLMCYNKDNETNYLNYKDRDRNRSLFEYYQGLIALRRAYPALSNAPKKSISFLETGDDFFVAYSIDKKAAGKKKNTLLVLLNGNPDKAQSIKLPKGKWKILADASNVSTAGLGTPLSGTAAVPPTSGMILSQ